MSQIIAPIFVEVHLSQKIDQRYPITITIQPSGQIFSDGYLNSEVAKWQPSGNDQADGQALFNWLFSDENSRFAWQSLHNELHLKLRLRIDKNAPELYAVPWELLYNQTFLAADARTPFSRYLALPTPSGAAIHPEPLRLLVAVASPSNLSDTFVSIDVKAEQQLILNAVSRFPQIEVTFVPQPVTRKALHQALSEGYHLLHVVAHGQFNKRQNQFALLFANENNQQQRVTDTELVNLIKPLGVNKPAFIFLAACQSATHSPTKALSGLAPRLVAEADVSAVLAMQENVLIQTARIFTETFYHTLAESCYVDSASNAARRVLAAAGLAGGAVPVLFSRLQDNRLLAKKASRCLRFEPETVHIPAGAFIMGTDDGKLYEGPAHEVTLPTYRIGKYPVTNEQFAEFLRQTKRLATPEMRWDGNKPLDDRLKEPVTGITWDEAKAYCAWLSQVTGQNYRLPSEAHWEKAAQNEVYGCHDMLGQIREWCNTVWGENQNTPTYSYPWRADGREDDAINPYLRRVYRGGADGLVPSYRRGYKPDKAGPRKKRHGFRVMMGQVD